MFTPSGAGQKSGGGGGGKFFHKKKNFGGFKDKLNYTKKSRFFKKKDRK